MTLKARLAQLLTENAVYPNPRWLVKFDGQPHNKGEEVYQHNFGKVLVAAEEAGSDNNQSDANSANKEPSSNEEVTESGPKPEMEELEEQHEAGLNNAGPSGSSEEEDGAENDVAKKKSVSFSNESSPALSDQSSQGASDAKKVSAREQRSRRRQAILEDEKAAPGSISNANAGKKRPLPKNVKNAAKKARADDNDECVKIKFLTGTLYLYRGRHRRAEFIRKI